MSSKLQNQNYLMEFLPLRIEFTEGIRLRLESSGLDHKLMVLSLFTNNSSQKYHEGTCKFQLRVSGYFDGEYRKICPCQVIDQKLRRHCKQF